MADEAAATVTSLSVVTSDGDTVKLPIGVSDGVRPVPRWAGIGIFLILLFGAIALSRDFLMPITMGILLFFVFMPLRRRWARRGIPPWATATMVTGALVAFLALVMLMLSGPAGQLISDAPQIVDRLEAKFADLRQQFKGLEEAATSVGGTSEESGETDADLASAAGTSMVISVVNVTPLLVGQLIFVLVLLFFLLTSGDLLYLKIVQSFDSIGDKRAAYDALRQIEQNLGSYLGTITLINALLGVAIGVSFWMLDMPAPALFGIAAALLNFIPYVGAVIGAGISTAVALVSMDGFAQPIMVGLAYVVINAIEGQFVTPYFLSRRLELNTVVVFVAVALWAWLWSIVGMIVAVPILVTVRVLFEHIPGLEKLANFLAGEDAPPAPPEDQAPV